MTNHDTKNPGAVKPSDVDTVTRPSRTQTVRLLKPIDWERFLEDSPGYDPDYDPRGDHELVEIEVKESGTPEPVPKRESWLAVDLAPYIDGTIKRDVPTMGAARTDGVRLLYPGKEHTVIGETESGKTWFALACVAAELNAYRANVSTPANRHVMYFHFEESDPTNTINRLHDMGVSWRDVEDNFHFYALDVPLTQEKLSQMGADFIERVKRTGIKPDVAPTLVILDGMTEAMALHGLNVRDETDVARFRRMLVQPFKKQGAATLICDHVVKDREKRDRGPIGSVHKLNALDGAAYLLENVEPIVVGKRGASRLYVTKDRPGEVRKHAVANRSVPGKGYLGMFTVDSHTVDDFTPEPYVDLSIVPPKEEDIATPVDHAQRKADQVEAAIRSLRENRSGPFSTRQVRAEAHMNKEAVADALSWLANRSRVTHSKHGNADQWNLPE